MSATFTAEQPGSSDTQVPEAGQIVSVRGATWAVADVQQQSLCGGARWWAEKLVANVARDERNTLALRELGWAVVRIWEHEPVDAAVARVVEEVESARLRN